MPSWSQLRWLCIKHEIRLDLNLPRTDLCGLTDDELERRDVKVFDVPGDEGEAMHEGRRGNHRIAKAFHIWDVEGRTAKRHGHVEGQDPPIEMLEQCTPPCPHR